MKKKVSYAVAIIFAVICMSFAFSANAAQKELNSDTANVTLKTTSYIYYNNEKEPKPTVTYTENDSTVTLKNGTDYTLSYENNKNVGTATVTVTGIGDYTGSISADFTIEKYDLSQHTDTVSVSLSYTSCTYDGTAKKPTVTVKCPFNNTKETIVSGTDYTVKYSNNVNAGTAKVVITGKGNFKGSIEKTFKINKASLSSSGKTVASLKYTSVTYTSKSLKPSTTVYYYLTSNKKTKLTKDKDYTVTYSNNKNIGTATVKIKGTGNYTGSVKKTFKIIPKTVSGVKISNRTTSSFVVSWSKVSGVTGYQIYKYDSSSKSYKKYKTVKAGTTSVKISDLSSSKAYKIKVRAYKKVDDKTYYGKYSSKKTGVTNPKKVTITSVSKSGTTLSVKWNKVSCSGYEVIYTTDKNFKTGLKTKTISKSSTTSTSIKNLSKSKHY
ncbi:MAG: fibronectin type III domain-containing protein, partial [Clostridiales bacterium]|nr:fibronectin type III domain-containing protein [Clostridiales bacterium]